MRHIVTIFAALLLCSAPAQAQTVKALSYGTNGLFITGTNPLTFSNQIQFAGGDVQITGGGMIKWAGSDRIELETYTLYGPWAFDQPANVRTNLGLGATNNVTFQNITIADQSLTLSYGPEDDVFVRNESGNLEFGAEQNGVYFKLEPSSLSTRFNFPINFNNTTNAATTRTNLGLGATNIVTFAGLTNNGDIRINQTATNNGLLYIYRTNNEAFLGIANLIASNNTTISNETLFRVGVAEATNRSAQFGFRATNTNGNGVAVFSVFGFNALMQIGADSSTNAVIYSGGGTNNEVMTLIKDGATEFARPLRFSTNAASKPATNAPANTTNVAAWVEMQIGTNSYRVPLYQ